jgi:hypothetical protein
MLTEQMHSPHIVIPWFIHGIHLDAGMDPANKSRDDGFKRIGKCKIS